MILEHTSIICIIYLEKPGRLCYYIPCRRDVAQFGRALRSGRKGRRFESCHPDHRQTKQGLYPAFVVLSSLIIEDSNLGEAQPSMKGFGESLNRLWSAAARKGAARRQHASDSEAGGRILSSRPYWNASIDTILAFLFFLEKPLGARLFATL